MITAENELKILLAQPRFAQAIAAHARGNPETDPVKRVHGAVSSIAPHLADLAAAHARRAQVAKDEAKKVSKSSVDYRPGSVARHCGNCSMYRDHLCTLVRGTIDPSATCKKWEAQKGSQHFQAHSSILMHARFAPDGHHYVPDPNRPGKYARVVSPQGSGGQGTPGSSQTGAAVNGLAAPGGSPGNIRNIDLIRHGSTDLNSEDTSVDVIRGHKDVPLNAEGKQQAAKVGEQIAKSPNKPDVLVASDLCRAKLTAEIISKAANIPIGWVTDHFRPWDAGQLTGQPSKQAVPIMGQYAEQRPDEALPGGESFHTFLGRLFIGIDEALRRYPGKRVGIVSHHRDERSLHAWRAKGFPLDGSIDQKVFNQKGETTGTAQTFQLPADRVRVVAQRYRDAAMAQPPAQRQVSDDQPGQE